MDDKVLVDVIDKNKNLIYSIIHRYGHNFSIDDLYQVGVIGIIKAYNNFDRNRDIKFSTYAYKYILSEVLEYINGCKMIKTSREYRQLGKKIMEVRNILTQKLMREPSNYDISVFLGIDEYIINDVIRYQDSVRSLDEVDDGNITLIDRISSNEDIYDYDKILLMDYLKSLPKEEQELIYMRYFRDKTQSEIAEYFGTNQVQISRNEKKVLKKIKNNLCGTS